MTRYVTIARLKKMGACESAVAQLAEAFGSRIPLTPAGLTKVEKTYKGGVRWFANEIPELFRKVNLMDRGALTPKCPSGNRVCYVCNLDRCSRIVLLRAARRGRV